MQIVSADGLWHCKMNAIYIRRRMKFTVPSGTGETPMHVIAALQKNIASLGFVLAPELCERLCGLPLEKVESCYKSLVSALKEIVGAHREFRPIYPDFPQQVMEMSEARLYWNAILHYCTNRLLPFAKRERTPLLEDSEPKVIHLGTREDFESIFSLLVASKTSISAQDKADVTWFISQYRDDILRLLPDEIPSRENLATVGASLLRLTNNGAEWLSSRVKTATDVLRLAVAMSDGDVSLAAAAKFTRFSRSERSLLLSWIDRCANPTEDMLRWKGRWIRLGERLHPGDYSKRFPKAFAAFGVLRSDLPFETFSSAVEKHLISGDGAAAVTLLATRPGELTRRLDHLLRTAKMPDAVVDAFRQHAASVSTPVLLQAMTHFARRSEPSGLRTIFPKGKVAKVQAIENNLPMLPPGTDKAIAEICEDTLVGRFRALPPLGRCYLDGRLSDFLVPFSQRSAAKTLRTLVRGSRLSMPDCKVLRFFLWWRNGSSRTDIDLSAALYDAELKYVDVVAYYNLKNFGGCHSGDIVDAPEGAAEFIDLDVERTKAAGVRYVVMSINSFTMQPYCDLPECFAGWMARQSAGSGEIFEPRTVQDKVDIASDTRVCLPAVFDLVERRVLWMDIALNGSPYWNNVQNNLSGVSLMLRAMLGLKKTTLHTLFGLHIKARGQLTLSQSDADTVFSTQSGLTPFDLDRIAAEYL
jgi:hypothetical protein